MSEELLDKQDNLKVASNQRTTKFKIVASSLVVVGGVFAFIMSQLFAAVLAGLVLSGLFGVSSSRLEELFSNNAVLVVIYLLSSVLLVTILIVVCRIAKKNFLEVIGLKRKPSWSDAAWSLLAYAGYFVAFAFVAALILPIFKDIINIDQQQDFGVDFSLTVWNALILFIMFVVIPPIIEEVLFRGFMYRTVRKWMPKWLAAIIISILFGALHLELLSGNSPNWIAMIDTTILSVALIIVVEKTNSLWPAIYVHALKNLLAYTILISGLSL